MPARPGYGRVTGGSPAYGLVFDVDGVVADTEPLNIRATVAALAEVCGLVGVRAEDFEAGLGRGAEEYVRAGARAHGRELTPEQVAGTVRARLRHFTGYLEQEPLPPLPGVRELVNAALDDEAFSVAIATSGTREKSGAVLRAAGLPTQNMVRVTGDDVTLKKPDPELFLLAAQRLGLPPARCIVFEDAPSGVEAALRAGAKCVAVTTTAPREALARAHRVVESLLAFDLQTARRLIDDLPE